MLVVAAGGDSVRGKMCTFTVDHGCGTQAGRRGMSVNDNTSYTKQHTLTRVKSNK